MIGVTIEDVDIKARTADMCWRITRMQKPQNNVSYTRIHQSDDKAAALPPRVITILPPDVGESRLGG